MVEVYETSTILCRDALFDDEIEGKNIHQSGQKSSDINQNLELKHQQFPLFHHQVKHHDTGSLINFYYLVFSMQFETGELYHVSDVNVQTILSVLSI